MGKLWNMTNTFKTISWDEQQPEAGQAEPRIGQAHVKDEFAGVIQGNAVTEYLMYYVGQTGTYTGYSQLTGSVDGRAGSFVLAHTGTFEGTTVTGSWSVVEGSGTGELAGLRGEGGFVSRHGDPATEYTFDYTLGS